MNKIYKLAKVDEFGYVTYTGTFDEKLDGWIELNDDQEILLTEKFKIVDGKMVGTGKTSYPPFMGAKWRPDIGEWVEGRTKDEMWEEVRLLRDKALSATDWIITHALESGEQVPQVWREYRQALRDITEQEDPFNIVWPQKPS